MAKRKTIRVNPLDTLVPDPLARRSSESRAPVEIPSDARASAGVRTTSSQPSAKERTISTPAKQPAPPPTSIDVSSRLQSLEERNEYLTWLVGGAILLALLL